MKQALAEIRKVVDKLLIDAKNNKNVLLLIVHISFLKDDDAELNTKKSIQETNKFLEIFNMMKEEELIVEAKKRWA